MNLMQVKANGCLLAWPNDFPNPEKTRGFKGYVVDLDAPLEQQWCAGQMHKLEPAPKGSVVSPINHPVAQRLIKVEVKRLAEEKTTEPEPAVAAASANKSDADLEEPRRGKKAG